MNISRAAYTPQSGDTYVLKIGGVIKSSGTVSVSGSTFTFNPSSGKPSFTATFEYGAMVNIDTITLDDNTTVTLPDMIVSDYEGGYASTIAEENTSGKTIAGCAYSEKAADSGTFIWSYKHYLLTVSYADALSTLKTAWGDPDQTTDCSLQNGDSTVAVAAAQNGGVLFEVTDYDYRLAVWAELTVGATTTSGWSTVVWSKNDVRTELTDTGTDIGGCGYSQKDADSGSDPWSCKHYLLSISYDAALSILKGLWGPPRAGVLMYYGGSTLSNQAFQNDGVLFEDDPWYYRLCRVVNGQSQVVAWPKSLPGDN
jgi:hypothetical protein